MVPEPSFLIRAGHEVRRPSSRSVAVRYKRSPEASSRTFDRIGMVVFFSTTPCDRLHSRTRSALLTVNSIEWLSPSSTPSRPQAVPSVYLTHTTNRMVARAPLCDGHKY